MFAWSDTELNLAPVGEVRRVKGLYASGELFQTLGVTPAAGRLIGKEDDRRGGATAVAVLSHSFWQRDYGGKTSAIDSKLTIEGHPFEIIGIASAWFTGVEVGKLHPGWLPEFIRDFLKNKMEAVPGGNG